jgi:hypothetical protein
MICEWWLPMHIDKTSTRLHRTVLLETPATNLTPPEPENLFALQRCSATSIATINSNPDR